MADEIVNRTLAQFQVEQIATKQNCIPANPRLCKLHLKEYFGIEYISENESKLNYIEDVSALKLFSKSVE